MIQVGRRACGSVVGHGCQAPPPHPPTLTHAALSSIGLQATSAFRHTCSSCGSARCKPPTCACTRMVLIFTTRPRVMSHSSAQWPGLAGMSQAFTHTTGPFPPPGSGAWLLFQGPYSWFARLFRSGHQFCPSRCCALCFDCALNPR